VRQPSGPEHGDVRGHLESLAGSRAGLLRPAEAQQVEVRLAPVREGDRAGAAVRKQKRRVFLQLQLRAAVLDDKPSMDAENEAHGAAGPYHPAPGMFRHNVTGFDRLEWPDEIEFEAVPHELRIPRSARHHSRIHMIISPGARLAHA
jgi:hypothetical protein